MGIPVPVAAVDGHHRHRREWRTTDPQLQCLGGRHPEEGGDVVVAASVEHHD